MGKRIDLSTVAEEEVEDVPGRNAGTLTRLKLDRLAPTPVNPRINFGTEAELAEFGESLRDRQLQPIVVVSRAAYLKLWPEHAKQIGNAHFVIANGERRWRASRQAKLSGIDAVIKDSVADSRPSFLDAVLKENLERQNLDPIEEAQAVEAMVLECGSASAAAEKFKRHESWVSQRRALLKLTSELQEQVRTGVLPVRVARSIASKPAAEQEPAWRALEEQQQQQRAVKKAKRPSGGEQQPNGGVPQPRGETPDGSSRTRRDTARTPSLPWDSTAQLAEMIRERLSGDALAELIQLLKR